MRFNVVGDQYRGKATRAETGTRGRVSFVELQ
jgi:hypothetical protein